MTSSDVIVRHRINDLQQFQNAFQNATNMLRKAGVTTASINLNVDDPNEVVAVLACTDVAKYRQWTQTAEYRTTMQNAGATNTQYTFIEELATMPATTTTRTNQTTTNA